MALPTQTIHLPLGGGLSQKVQDVILDPGQGLLSASNLIHVKGGSLAKALGYSNVNRTTSLGSNLSSAAAVFGYKDELDIIGSTSLPVTTPAIPNSIFARRDGVADWTYRRNCVPSECVVGTRFGVGTGTVFDACVVGSYLAVVYQTTTGTQSTFVAIYDTNGVCVFAPWALSINPASNGTRLAAVGNTLWVLYVNGTAVLGQYVDVTSTSSLAAGLSGPPTTFLVGGTVAASPANMIDAMGGSTHLYLAYVKTGSIASVASFNAAGTNLANSNLVGDAGVNSVGIGGLDTDTVWLAYAKSVGHTVKVIGLDSSLATIATASTVLTADGAQNPYTLGVVRTAATQAVLTVGNDFSGAAQFYWRPFDRSAGAVRAGGASGIARSTAFNVLPQSKPFVVSGRPYAMARLSSATQNYLYCLDLTLDAATSGCVRHMANISPRLAVPPGNLGVPFGPPVSTMSTVSTFVWVTNSLIKSTVVTGIEFVGLDFASASAYSRASLLELVALAGGAASYYDGQGVAELGFAHYPEVSVAAGAVGAGAFPAAGTWKYAAVFRHVDARGQLHRSAPTAAPATFASGATGYTNTTVTLNTLQLSQRAPFGTAAPQPVIIEVYRTTSAGSVYYLAGTVKNDPSVSTVAFTDSMTDVSLQSQELLYSQVGTNGTALPRLSPPGLLRVISHVDRLWGIEGQNLWYSGQAVIGEGPWFSDAFQLAVTAGDGPLTNLASMDGRLFLFKRNRIFVIDGQGPADNGTGNDLASPQMLPFDVGCIDGAAVLVTAEGIWFQSLRGIELLGRSLQLAGFVGDAVEDITSGQVIKSATVDEANGRIQFVVNGGAVYRDLVFGTWTQGPTSVSMVSNALVGSTLGKAPTFSWVSSTGVVSQQTQASYLQAGAFAPSQFETGWIKLAGLQGFQRIRRVNVFGKSLAPHGVTLQLAFDYSPSYTEYIFFDETTIAGLAGHPLWTLSHVVANQRCSAIRILVNDAAPASPGTGAGAVFYSVAIEYAAIDKLARLPAANKG
jgi:hypothetical protein